jgi:hypothetical protein
MCGLNIAFEEEEIVFISDKIEIRPKIENGDICLFTVFP